MTKRDALGFLLIGALVLLFVSATAIVQDHFRAEAAREAAQTRTEGGNA